MRIIRMAGLLAGPAVLLAACGGGSTTAGGQAGPGGGRGPEIIIKNFTFVPASLEVKPGTTVTVVNEDSAVHTLSATGGGAAFTTGNLSEGHSATIKAPAKDGRYTFNCGIHNYMTGTIVVSG